MVQTQTREFSEELKRLVQMSEVQPAIDQLVAFLAGANPKLHNEAILLSSLGVSICRIRLSPKAWVSLSIAPKNTWAAAMPWSLGPGDCCCRRPKTGKTVSPRQPWTILNAIGNGLEA